MRSWMLLTEPLFRELDIPLRPSQRHELEKKIKKGAPVAPIPIWHNYVMMNYDLHDLCEKYHRFCTVKSMSFARKNEAAAWICREQLKRADLCRQAVCWLLYQLYMAELETENRKAAKVEFQYKQLSPSRHSSADPERKAVKTAVLRQIGDEYHLTKETIRNYVRFGERVDQLEEMFPGIRKRILKGEVEMPLMFAEALMQMPQEELEKMISDPQCRKLIPPKDIVSRIRNQRDPRYKKRIRVETAIKETPPYDPDAELNGLAWTVGAWIKAISRTEISDLEHATGEGKKRLRDELARLKQETDSLYKMLEVKDHE